MTSALFVSHTGEKGGAEIFLIDLLKDGPADWQGCFLSGGSAVDELASASRRPILLSAGARMLAIKRNSSFSAIFRGLKDVLDVARQLGREARHFDVLCANSQKSLFVCAFAAKLARKPLIWILHDIVTDPSFSAVNRRAGIMFSRLFADIVVVNSEETGRAFVEAGGQKDKVRLVYNGFRPEASPQHDADKADRLRRELGLDGRPIIGLFGRLSEWKGQHVLLNALAEIPDAQALIVGGALFGQEAYEARIRQLCSTLGLDGRVRFLGHRTDVSALMASVDIVAHSSIAPEPFGRVVVEGQLAGRPVIASRAGGVTEIVTDGETGLLVPPDDASALAGAVKRLLADPKLAETLASNGSKDAARRFSLTASLAAMSAVLAETQQPEMLGRQVGAGS
jgi:glycosyltransferase involved in cell wall biosynthesis